MMPLHVNVISGEKLLKRWHMSEPELLFMKLNQGVKTVHRERDMEGWLEDSEDDLMRMVVEGKYRISSFTFDFPGVLALEDKYPELLSKSRNVMEGKDLIKRWDLDDAVLLDMIENHGLGATDPAGGLIDFSCINELLSYDRISMGELLFKVEDVEHFEKEHGIRPNDKAIGMPRKPSHRDVCEQRCREIAQQIWEKDPTITIRAMGEMEEIVAVTKRHDDNLYTEKTIREWIKDLNPNKGRHGRPKKK